MLINVNTTDIRIWPSRNCCQIGVKVSGTSFGRSGARAGGLAIANWGLGNWGLAWLIGRHGAGVSDSGPTNVMDDYWATFNF